MQTCSGDGRTIHSVCEVNIGYVGWIIFNIDGTLYRDSVVGKDSHTTMIDGIQVTGCGVGGIEAEVTKIGDLLLMRNN
ncbi:unnamed protein product [Cuscuta campestris]|uniref:Aconitase/3-isopropylmalate dehydratase large subunit alpha/beta/alpha domain-containing protein n=1 Tax=Cuscuta campestris TaxID=132261 RepID=A0A484N2Y6_9ASTE|nr:unnamed protein product [Cuscuta campestris]